MIQEIITYMIIGAAIALAISKAVQKVRGKRKPAKKVNFQKDSFALQHNCSDCSAECMLRNAAKPMIKENIDLCNKIENKGSL